MAHVNIDYYYGNGSDNYDGGGDVDNDSNDNLGACLLFSVKRWSSYRRS